MNIMIVDSVIGIQCVNASALIDYGFEFELQ